MGGHIGSDIGAFALSFLNKFSSPKYVVIQDIWLGICLRTAQILVTGYLIFDIFYNKSYLLTEQPFGLVNPWSERGDTFTPAVLANQFNNAPYCVDPDLYVFQYNDEFTYDNLQCVLYEGGTGGMKRESSMFFPTYFTDTRTFYTLEPSCPVPPEGKDHCCPEDVPSQLEGATFVAKLDMGTKSVCYYRRVENMLVTGAELTYFAFWHSYQTTQLDKSGSLPRTHVRDYKGVTMAKYPKNQTPLGTLDAWLSLAGVDLDKTWDQQPAVLDGRAGLEPTLTGRGISQGKFPVVRLAGAKVIITLNYFNNDLHESGATNTDPSEVIALVDVEAQFDWSTLGNDILQMGAAPTEPWMLTNKDIERAATKLAEGQVMGYYSDMYRHGIDVRFRVSGLMGQFAFPALVDKLTSGVVLFGLAQVLVQYIALYLMGTKSKLYTAFMEEKVNYKRELARFAAQSIVSGMTFKKMDITGNDELDTGEVLGAVKKFINGSTPSAEDLTDAESLALAHFLTSISDDAVKKKITLKEKGAKTNTVLSTMQTNSVNISEWINIFTDEKVTLDMVKTVLEKDYKQFLEDVEQAAKDPESAEMRGLIGGINQSITQTKTKTKAMKVDQLTPEELLKKVEKHLKEVELEAAALRKKLEGGQPSDWQDKGSQRNEVGPNQIQPEV